MNLTRSERLENEAIRLLREAVGSAERAALIAAPGPAGAALLHLASKAFHPAPPPFAVVDGPATGHDVLLVADIEGAGPELWHTVDLGRQASPSGERRVAPLAGWTVLDVWRYVAREGVAGAGDPPPAARIRAAALEINVMVCGGAGHGKSALAERVAGDGAGPGRRLPPGGRDVSVLEAPAGDVGLRALLARASAAHLVLVVVAAPRGITAETRRQLVLLSSIGVRRVALVVNQMDLVSYEAGAFARIQVAYRQAAGELGLASDMVIPASALGGDNVSSRSAAMPWYDGPTVLDLLDSVAGGQAALVDRPLRLPVQWASTAGGAAGTIAAGRLKRGDTVRVQPSGRTARITRLVTAAGDAEQAEAGRAVTVALDGGVVPARGDLIVAAADPGEIADQFEATLIWLGEAPLLRGRGYLLQAGTRTVTASVAPLKYRLNLDTLGQAAATTLKRGEIGVGNLQLDRAIAFDPYGASPETGGLVLTDRQSGETVGIGMLRFALRRSQNVHWQAVDVNKAARAALKRQRPCLLWYTGLSGAGKSTIANLVDKKLHSLGRHTYLLDGDNVRHGLNRDLGFTDADRVENIRRVAEVARLMVDAGLIVSTAFISPFRAERSMARALLADGEFIEVFIDTPLGVAEERDPKGLYKKARRGDLKNFTGIDSPYERPDDPELIIDTTAHSPEQAAESIIADLDARGILGGS